MSEDRQKIWDEYQGNKPPTVRHNFVDYDRYFEAENIKNVVGDILEGMNRKWSDLKVIDFGCCAADYGIFFARLGCHVWCEDIDPDALSFMEYRFRRENLRTYKADKYDLYIFGEVLEHCDDAFSLLKDAVDKKADFIFTSSYPYRNDSAEDDYWKGRGHSDKARQDQPRCRHLLEKYYEKITLGGERKVWIRKDL